MQSENMLHFDLMVFQVRHIGTDYIIVNITFNDLLNGTKRPLSHCAYQTQIATTRTSQMVQ